MPVILGRCARSAGVLVVLLVACASPLAQFEGGIRDDVARGRDFNQKNEEGQTLLHRIAMRSHEVVMDTARVRMLLEAGADPQLPDPEGNTPLHLLDYGSSVVSDRIKGAQVALAAALLEAGADPNARNHEEETPLHRTPNPGVALLLLEAGADPNAQDNAGETPLHQWSWLGAEVTAALLAAGADPNVRNSAGEAPLHEAAGVFGYSTNYIDDTRVADPQARLLLLAGAEVNAADTLGRTPLHRAVRVESPVHRVLLAGGADPNARDTNGRTPLHEYASRYNRPNLVPDAFLDPLLAAGADVNAPDRLGRSPLHLARNLERIRVLLDGGANPAPTDSSGATPLHLPWWSDPDQIGALAGRGVDVNARDHAGRTPLLNWACASSSVTSSR
ncbi:MAG: ankyrin repeat domain-containing protein, partial [Gammaproteobacteria bacterium]|nr:ankyrin repeat domain-containing protein [Gammaproteobacteria bacterium]